MTMHTPSLQKGHTNSSQGGFTLIETLIAITILASAVAGTMTIAFQGLRGAQLSSDQMVASYLAQEGIDFIRSKRDENYLSRISSGMAVTDWDVGLDACKGGTGCTIDMTVPSNNPVACGSPCSPLTINVTSGLYGQRTPDATWVASPFTRRVTMTSASQDVYSIVTVTVTWQTGPIARSLTLREVLTNWQPKI